MKRYLPRLAAVTSTVLLCVTLAACSSPQINDYATE